MLPMINVDANKLLKHVDCVCKTVLGFENTSSINISILTENEQVFENFCATRRFTILIDFSSFTEILDDAQKKLSSFLGKKVCTYTNAKHTYLYWEEGEPLDPFAKSHACSDLIPQRLSGSTGIDWLKTDTTLPKWLDNLLFESLNARYSPDWQRFDRNLDLCDDEIKIYLGTYFPRSYAESFCILDSLLNNSIYSKHLKTKSEITLLDIGTGTGGNLIGLMSAISKHCQSLERVTIHGFDGNSRALDAARIILRAFSLQMPFKVDIILTPHIVSQNNLPFPPSKLYDFITTSKIGSEIIASSEGNFDNFYYEFLKSYANLLSDFGILLILDVTTKPRHTNFYPTLLNEQTSRFVRSNLNFHTITPIPCYLYEKNCFNHCFTQKTFRISHRSARKDRSLVTYRAITRNTCSDIFHISTQNIAQYIICDKLKSNTFKICPFSTKNQTYLDAFKI